MLLGFNSIRNLVSPPLMEPRGLRVNQTTYFSLLTHAKQLLLVTLAHTPAGIGNSEVGRDRMGRTTDDYDGRRRKDGQT